jgi:hypothetical protein
MSSPRHRSRHPTVWSQLECRHQSTDEHEIWSRAKSPADRGPVWISTVAIEGRTVTTTSALHCLTSSYETHHCDPADEATPPTGTVPRTAQGPPPRHSGRGDPSDQIRAPRRYPSPTATSHTVAGEERKVDGGKPRRRLVVAASTRLDQAGSAALGAGNRAITICLLLHFSYLGSTQQRTIALPPPSLRPSLGCSGGRAQAAARRRGAAQVSL